MNIETVEGWNANGNHDSKYDEDEIKALIAQACDLAGVSSANDRAKMPERIRVFVENCLLGETTIWVTKGIHQRWDRINATDEITKNADPHIQVKFGHRFGNSPLVWIAIHVRLSEEPMGVRRLYSGQEVIDCAWRTVGLSCERNNLKENWPAYFSQEVGNIQAQGSGRNGFKRRYSVGCLVALTDETGK